MIIFSNVSYGQEVLKLKLKNNKDSLNNQFPFQLGLEGGAIWDYDDNYYDNQIDGSFFAYLNINLSQRKTFLKFQYGVYHGNNRYDVGFISIGLDYKIMNSNTHNVSVSSGLALYGSGGSEGGAGFSFPIEIRYLYYFNSILGITGSLKLPVFPFRFIPNLGIGFQLN